MSDSTPSGDLVLYHGPEFGTVPTALISDTSLTPGARLLCALLWTYRNKDTGEAFPSQERLARELGCSERSVKRWLKALALEGWLLHTKRIHKNPEWRGNPNACLYEIYWSKGDARAEVTQSHFRSDSSVPSEVTPASPEHTNRTDQKNFNSDTASISKTEKALLDADVYPRTMKRLIEGFPEDRIMDKVQHFTGGELVRAIEEDWIPKAQGSTKNKYASGQFADFWDLPTSKEERSGPNKIGDVLP